MCVYIYTCIPFVYYDVVFYVLQIPRHDKGIQWNLSIRRSNLNLGCRFTSVFISLNIYSTFFTYLLTRTSKYCWVFLIIQVIQREPWEHIRDEDIKKAAASFCGEIYQVPPMFSAIKVKEAIRFTRLFIYEFYLIENKYWMSRHSFYSFFF